MAQPLKTTAPGATNLNALFLKSWRRFGSLAVIDDGQMPVTMNHLARRVAAISCFIDESCGDSRGPVILYLPPGEQAIAAFFGVLMTGRPVLPLDPAPRRSFGPVTVSHPSTDEAAPLDFARLSVSPSLIVTLRPLERALFESSAGAICRDTPTLLIGELAERMDPRHQDIIRERTHEAWFHAQSSIDPDSPAIYSGADPISHRNVVNEVIRRMEELGEPAPRRFLTMTPMGRLATWTSAYLPALGLAGQTFFIRVFHPPHIIQLARDEKLEVLLMTSLQYEAVLPLARQLKPHRDIQYWVDTVIPASLRRSWKSATGREIHVA